MNAIIANAITIHTGELELDTDHPPAAAGGGGRTQRGAAPSARHSKPSGQLVSGLPQGGPETFQSAVARSMKRVGIITGAMPGLKRAGSAISRTISRT